MIITKECLKVCIHDTSTTGIRYKLRVELDKRISKSKLGMEVLDTSNNLYRAIQFRYAIHPNVETENKKTIFYYFFNDVELAQKLSIWLTGKGIESEGMYKSLMKQRDEFNKKGYPSYNAPYYYSY